MNIQIEKGNFVIGSIRKRNPDNFLEFLPYQKALIRIIDAKRGIDQGFFAKVLLCPGIPDLEKQYIFYKTATHQEHSVFTEYPSNEDLLVFLNIF